MVIITKNVKIVCSKCGFINELDLDKLIMTTVPEILKVRCEYCRSINELKFDEVQGEAEKKKEKDTNWLQCITYKGPSSNMPRGFSQEPSGQILYQNSEGHFLDRMEYIKIYGIDPAVALEMMRRNRVSGLS